MGTRSTIALEFADGTVQQVYCHWDGYLDHNGAILKEHYSDPFKLRDLIDLGDLSSLRPEIGEKHAFSQFELRAEEVPAFQKLTEDMCTFYGRDRGETNINARKYKNADEYFDCSQQEEYDYILRNVEGTATWFVRCYTTNGVWLTMEEAKASQEEFTE
jgi:hypothetical protein